METIKTRFNKYGLWKQTGFVVYGLVGLTAFITLIWAIFKVSNNTFYATMGFFGSVGFWILVVGGLNWGIKFIFGKDLFGN